MKAQSVNVLVMARMCGLAIAVMAAGSCAPDDSTSVTPAEEAPTSVSEPCGAECDLTISSRILVSSADSVADARPIAEGTIIGRRGGELAIAVTGDSTVMRALGGAPALIVRINDSVHRLAWPSVGEATVVHRFSQDQERITMSYAIVPTMSRVPAGRLVLTQRLKGARVTSLKRRYAGWRGTGPKSLIGDAGCTGDVSIPGPGTYCGTVVAINPYVPNGGPFGGWQSNEGTGQSGPIEITFSSPVGSVRLTAIDPNFSGNLMTAYDAAGGQLGQVEFTGDGTPGALPPSRVTRSIAASGIRSVLLQPAIGEYIAYEDFVVNGSAQDSLRLTCTPSPVVRGQEVRCTARLTSNGEITPVLLTTTGPAGGTIGSFDPIEGGQAAQSRGLAIATAQVNASVIGPGGTPFSASATYEVVPRAFANPTFPSPPSVLDNVFGEDFCPVFQGCVLPVFGFFTTPDLAPNAADLIQILRATSGPQFGLAILEAPPALDLPFVLLGDPLGGVGSWYLDQNGIHGGSTVGPNGLRYCVGTDITGALRDDVIRHEGATPPLKSHYSIWLDAMASVPARQMFEQFTFSADWNATQVTAQAELIFSVFLIGAGGPHAAWDAEDVGGNEAPLAQQRIGCAFDTINPGD